MAFTNSYRRPVALGILAEEELLGPDPYDVNFVFPIHPESLETDRIRLIPFIPKVHVKAAWEVLSVHHNELFRFYPFVIPTQDQFLTFMERRVRRDPQNISFAIIDKTRPDNAHPELGGGSLAGLISLFDTSAEQLVTEIAFVMIFPAFQRTHVTSNAVGLLMKYCLDVPTASPPGLGLRRVQWHCHSKNIKSKQLAERVGFRDEGILRWHWVLPKELGADGHVHLRDGDPASGKPGRDTISLSVCWDDWENGGREKVQQQIDRRV
ncbi:unnamed protein product [Somion occarium]|uniref:N-acetyltransferase domain-containing protein n=1 Tax=Somion occarium TaxID=3059160 RepID=A0ABP1D4U1_9APHY